MKIFSVATILGLSACCFLSSLNPQKAYADTVTMNFTGVGGANSGGVYTFPYEFKVNNGPTISLMCVSYTEEIYQGEKWTATITPITTTPEKEEAYLDSVVLNSSSSAQTISDAQWAAWEAGDGGLIGHLPSGLDNADILAEYNAAVSFAANPANANFYSNFELYVPVAGSQSPSTDDLPQTFIGVTPEPSSLILLGSGLLSSAGMLYRRRRRV